MLTFNSTKTEAPVDIVILNETNETRPEVDEVFIVSLSFPGEDIPRVTLEPDNATVAIYEINGRSMIIQVPTFVIIVSHMLFFQLDLHLNTLRWMKVQGLSTSLLNCWDKYAVKWKLASSMTVLSIQQVWQTMCI